MSLDDENHPAITEPAGRRASISRRGLLSFGAGAALGLALGAGGSRPFGGRTPTGGDSDEAPAFPPERQAPVDPTGPTQPGVTRPESPPPFAFISVADLAVDRLAAALAPLGAAILRLQDSPDPVLLPDGPGDLHITIGLGPRSLDTLPGGGGLSRTLEMPMFAGDAEMAAHCRGGDLLIGVYGSDPSVLEPVHRHLGGLLPGFTPRWGQFGARGPGQHGISRNPFGYHDGVVVPRTPDAQAQDVWIDSGALADGTICVLRRFELDIARFSSLRPEEQDAIIGRERQSGAPLSGGALLDEIDVSAKFPNGEFVIPNRAHARAAHPSFTGSGLMMRRSYSFASTGGFGADDGPGSVSGAGLLFVSFQNDIRTFVLTQQRLDEVDALMDFVRPSATAAFAILPGHDAHRPLGSSLI